MSMSHLKRLAVPLLAFSLFLMVLLPTVRANAEEDPCALGWKIFPQLCTFVSNKIVEPIIAWPRTQIDQVASIILSALPNFLVQRNSDEAAVCAVYNFIRDDDPKKNLLSRYSGGTFDPDTFMGFFQGDAGGALYAPEELEAAKVAGATLNCDFNTTFLGSGINNLEARRNNGSLGGIAKAFEVGVLAEPPPVSLAYYVQHNVQKVPGLQNTAFAATSYPAWGLELVLSLWETSRDLAYGIISVIMLVIGIMIITRKRISPQAVVTVQTALPRVIISILLITFSYPIGATLISLVFPLMIMVFRLYLGIFLDNLTGFENGLMDLDALVTVINILISGIAGGQGLLGVALGWFLFMATVGLTLFAMIKIMLIQLKMLVAIVVAPLQFAVAAVPGNENLIADWFKKMIAKVVSIPAMFVLIGIAWYLIIAPFTDVNIFASIMFKPSLLGVTVVPAISFIRAANSRVLTLVMLPLMTIAVLMMAVKAPKQVEEFITGEGGSGGKKRK